MEIINKKKPSRFEYDKWNAKYGLDPKATSKEKDLWWGKEREYWQEGRFGLTGTHYFALTQGTIKDARGFKKRPIWRDIDELIYEGYKNARETNHDLFVSKRREVGLSLIFGGIVPVWVALTYPGSTSLITSADKTRLETLFKEKTRVVFDNLDPWVRPGVVSTRQAGYLHMGQRNNITGEITGIDSQIITKETVDTPTALEAFRAMHCFLDEAFLHPKADQVYKSAQASVKSGFLKVAPIVIGGSAGESTSIGQKLANNLWNNADNLNLLTIFLPGYQGIMEAPELDENGKETGKVLNFCPNGWSDEVAAKEWLMKTRDKLDKIDDKSFLNSFVKQYPLEIHEVFSSTAEGALPKHIIDKLNAQERIILATQPPIEKVILYKDLDGTIQKRGDNRSSMQLLEPPNPTHTYIAGIDPIPFISKNMGDGSNQAIIIKDLDLNRYVAHYTERDSDPDQIVSNMILLQEYYNNAVAMIEVNRGGVVLDKYKQFNKINLLAKKPIFLGKGFTKADGSYGYYKNDTTSERGNTYLIEYLSANSTDVWFMEIIEEAKGYLKENTDILDALIACELLHKNIVEKHKKTETDFKPIEKTIPMLEYVNGRYQRVWKKVRMR
jgi:hypothetical protein